MTKESKYNSRKCQWCGKFFTPRVHNGIYHSAECRRLATNEKVLRRYYEIKDRKNSVRTCLIADCTTRLSKYNEEDICEAHKTERLIKRLVSWGHNEERLRAMWRDELF